MFASGLAIIGLANRYNGCIISFASSVGLPISPEREVKTTAAICMLGLAWHLAIALKTAGSEIAAAGR